MDVLPSENALSLIIGKNDSAHGVAGEGAVQSTVGISGTISHATQRDWDARDTVLYALGVGAGAIDPVGFELAFTTENSKGVPQRVLPTFVSTLGTDLRGVIDLSQVDRSKLVHGEQSVTVYGPLPAEGSVSLTTTLLDILNKGSGCLVEIQTEGRATTSSDVLFRSRMGLFIKGGGDAAGTKEFSSERLSSLSSEPLPSRPADVEVTYATRTDQGLLYRLSGDHNPLHSDPTFAARAGFPRPILHGLCTYGFTGRGLLHSLCDSDPAQFGSMSARFSKPVYPGDHLTISVWDASAQLSGAFRFRTCTQDGDVVIDGGVFQVRSEVVDSFTEH